jgi:LDH2 family malate/lactate/ureidoglycolate dehydrogenase
MAGKSPKKVLFFWLTNTTANMPAWGATNPKLGNNPIVFATPFGEDALVLDMAMSQYSFGAMELAVMRGENLSVVGGYDKEGNITNEPSIDSGLMEVFTRRVLERLAYPFCSMY